MGVRVSQVKPSNCFRLHPTSTISKHSTIPIPDSLQAPRKNEFYLPLLTQDFQRWWCETCRVIRQQFWTKECDILGRVKNIIWPLLHIFRGQDPQPPQYKIRFCPHSEKIHFRFRTFSLHHCPSLRYCAIQDGETISNQESVSMADVHIPYLLTWFMLSWGGGLRICIE